MKTQAIHWQYTKCAERFFTNTLKLDSKSMLRVALSVLAAIFPAALVFVVTIWATGTGALAYVSAFYWATGFVFLALMVDNDNGKGAILAGSGVALMALAWLSANVAPEFGVLAGFVLAGWVAASIVNRLLL